ncbi:HAD-IA family hydrolase [Candidatus Bathyarchaeota archaeon]|nr:HAD-IA family hydrolase [Candidatus Bathyarchaeota archaeon]
MTGIVVNGAEIECRAVIFDLDGTLVDKDTKNRALAEARLMAMREVAGEAAALRWARLSGVDPKTLAVDKRGPLSKAPRREDRTVGTTAVWLGGVSWFEARELAAEAYDRADAIQSREYRPTLVEGTEEALRAMRDTGLALGIATNGSGGTAREVMEAIGVDSLFDVYVGADDVAEGKPAPDMILEACRRLGVQPVDAVYVGDEITDAVAAVAAAVKATVIIFNDQDVSEYTEHVVGSVADIMVKS